MAISSFYKYVKTSIRYSRQKQFPNEGSQTFWCFASFFLFSDSTLWPISTGWGEFELFNPWLQTKPKHFLRAREERRGNTGQIWTLSDFYNLHTTRSFFYLREIWSLRRQVHDRIIFYPGRYFFTFSVENSLFNQIFSPESYPHL